MLLQTEGAGNTRPIYQLPECDLLIRHKNLQATSELVIPVHLVCNTPDDVLIANVKANSALKRKWIGTAEEHGSVALICGSGPSLSDHLQQIMELQRSGAKVFAMNGAAAFLHQNGILPDYQVIADARERTKDLIGPAKKHIFASQVHPSLFEAKPEAQLFHINFCKAVGQFLDLLPGYEDEYALIGSHGSVGNCSLGLAFTLGYRDIKVFGFDSSHRDGQSHSFSQPMNAEEPITTVLYDGKEYICTYTMKSQADVFPRLAYEIEQLGGKIDVCGSGLLPDRWRGERSKSIEQRETEKYQAIWNYSSYRDRSPATEHVVKAILSMGVEPGDTLVDFGCGTGRATKALIDNGVDAVGVDIAPNALENDVPFTQSLLWNLPDEIVFRNSKFGLCCDVMEHIPTEKVSEVLRNISQSVTEAVYFTIDDDLDEMGVLIGATLHLTVKPEAWWKGQLLAYFNRVETPEKSVFICWK